MAETPITHIERIEIKGLWGKYDIDWTLDPKVSILIGINGSGKTTVLNLVEMIFKDKSTNNNNVTIFSICKDAIIHFNYLGNIKVIEYLSSLENRDKKIQNPFYFLSTSPDLEKIATFETEYQPLEAIQQLSNQDVKTNLDWDLWNLEKGFKGYQSKILNRYRKEKIESVFEKSDLFSLLVNQLFEKTGKSIFISEESDITFQQDKEKLSLYQLSSGEKQMLIILLKVLLQDNQPYILLLDEPEISMHLSWQVDLIDNIQKLNENCQLIIATHSPSIIQKGWGSKVFLMKENEEDTRGILHKINQEVAA